jgi:hypothetical protein
MRRKRASPGYPSRSQGFLSTVTEQVPVFHVNASGILLPYADRPGPDEAERYYEGLEQARLAIEAAIKLEAHRQPPKQPRVSRESEHQLQALRTSN